MFVLSGKGRKVMRDKVLLWAVCSVIGGAIVALPDSGPRLFTLSRAHGPSAVDSIGVLVLLAGWSVPVLAVWQRRERVAHYIGTPVGGLALFALGCGAGLLVASVGSDYVYWWVIGVVLLVAGQLLVASMASTGDTR